MLETPGIVGCLEIAADSEKALDGRGEKDGVPAGESAGIEISRIFSWQPETEHTADENKDDNDFDADFAGALSKTVKTLNTSELVTGVVTKVSPTEVVVDIGTAHIAYIPRDEWSFDSAFDATASLHSQVKKGIESQQQQSASMMQTALSFCQGEQPRRKRHGLLL